MTTLSAQISLDDLLAPVRQGKSFPEWRKFLEAKGFDYDSEMLPGSTGKLYSFTGSEEYSVQATNGESLNVADLFLLRMDAETQAGKLTLMTASQPLYQRLVEQVKARKFKAKEHQDKSKPMAYTSEEVAGIAISLSATQAVNDGKVYNRYTIAVNY